jgi:hypothetical protein
MRSSPIGLSVPASSRVCYLYRNWTATLASRVYVDKSASYKREKVWSVNACIQTEWGKICRVYTLQEGPRTAITMCKIEDREDQEISVARDEEESAPL